MMPAAKRASYFFSAPSIALPSSPRGSARTQEFPGRDILWHVVVVKVAKNKKQKVSIY